MLRRWLLLALAGTCRPASTSPDDLTGPWQLFLDDEIIESTSNVRRQYHGFVKHEANPVLTAVGIGEGTNLFGTVLGPWAAGSGRPRYMMWYEALRPHTIGTREEYFLSRFSYATSEDGLAWNTSQHLNMIDYGGSSDNNIFWTRTDSIAGTLDQCKAKASTCRCTNVTKFKAGQPPSEPGNCRENVPNVIYSPWDGGEERAFKLINWNYGYKPMNAANGSRKDTDAVWPADGYYGASSPDGIHFEDSGRVLETVWPNQIGDVGLFNVDYHRDRYMAFVKLFENVTTSCGTFSRRSVGMAFNRQFDAPWPQPKVTLLPDEIDDSDCRTPEGNASHVHAEFYAMAPFAYQSQYVGLLLVARFTPATKAHPNNDGTIDVQVVSSRDGRSWRRADGSLTEQRPVALAHSPVKGDWDGGMIHIIARSVVADGDRIRLYYCGVNSSHGEYPQVPAVGLATLRKDGWASMRPVDDAKPATILTKPLAGAGGQPLLLNFATLASAGVVKVEVTDASSVVLPGWAASDCTPLTGDSTRAAVTWGGKSALPLVAGPGLRLRFVLQQAELYSFAAGDAKLSF